MSLLARYVLRPEVLFRLLLSPQELYKFQLERAIQEQQAREITKERLRRERELLLQEQDVAYMRAQESGADTSIIVAEKQRLRDITNLADDANTLDELKALKS